MQGYINNKHTIFYWPLWPWFIFFLSTWCKFIPVRCLRLQVTPSCGKKLESHHKIDRWTSTQTQKAYDVIRCQRGFCLKLQRTMCDVYPCVVGALCWRQHFFFFFCWMQVNGWGSHCSEGHHVCPWFMYLTLWKQRIGFLIMKKNPKRGDTDLGQVNSVQQVCLLQNVT